MKQILHKKNKSRKQSHNKSRRKTRKYIQKGGSLTIQNIEQLNALFNDNRIQIILSPGEYDVINKMKTHEIPNDGNCTYNAIANSFRLLYGDGFTSASLRDILANNIDDEYCLMLLYISYKSINNDEARAYLENGRRPLSRPYSIGIFKYLRSINQDIISFFEANNKIEIYDLLFNREALEEFYKKCLSKCKDISAGVNIIKNIIRRNDTKTPIEHTQVIPTSLLFLDTNYELNVLLNILNLIIIEINDKDHTLTLIKGNKSNINLDTRFIIMKVKNIHTDGYKNQDAYLYTNLSPEISEPIKLRLRSL